MTHEERWNLAQQLCRRLAEKHKEKYILGGVYGSTARGTDTDWSDLELFFVLEGDMDESSHVMIRGIPVSYRVIGQSALKRLLTNPSSRWPFHMGVLSVLKVLQGNVAQIQGWLSLGEAVPRERFYEALATALPGLVWESYGRIRSCQERGNIRDLSPSVLEVLFEMSTALCLLNASWTTHGYYQGLVDTFDFPKLPRDYPELVTSLWDSRGMAEAVHVAERLVANFNELLAREGVHMPDYNDLSELAL